MEAVRASTTPASPRTTHVSPAEYAAAEIGQDWPLGNRPYDMLMADIIGRAAGRIAQLGDAKPIPVFVPVACESQMAAIDALFGDARPSEVLFRLELLRLNDLMRQLPLGATLDRIEASATEYAQ